MRTFDNRIAQIQQAVEVCKPSIIGPAGTPDVEFLQPCIDGCRLPIRSSKIMTVRRKSINEDQRPVVILWQELWVVIFQSAICMVFILHTINSDDSRKLENVGRI
jgi:hypothetical protein